MVCPEGCWLRERSPDDSSWDEIRSSRDTEQTLPIQDLSSVAPQLYSHIQPWETRVLQVLPGRLQDPLRSKLMTAAVIHEEGLGLLVEGVVVPYYALSYCWGPTIYDNLLVCNGINVGITYNLWAALKYIRSGDRPIHIWVDALCINQHNAPEKSRQVQNMMSIYEKAKRVIGWLGPPSLGTNWAAYILQHKGTALLDFRDLGKHTTECASNVRAAVPGLNTLLSAPWFTRTWVRQEVFAARRLILRCGRQSLGLEAFKNVRHLAGNLNKYIATHGVEDGVIVVTKAVEEMRNSTQGELTALVDRPDTTDTPLINVWMELLISGSSFDCTEPRDRIYAYAGMAESLLNNFQDQSSKEFPRLEIDYSKSSADVCLDISMYFIKCTNSLASLQVCQSGPNRAQDIPSWVTDWRDVGTKLHLPINKDQDFVPSGRRPRQPARTLGEVCTFHRNGTTTTLECSGVSFGKIEQEIRPKRTAQSVEFYRFFKFVTLKPIGPRNRDPVTIQVPMHASPGDHVVRLNGAPMPTVLRSTDESKVYKVIGPTQDLDGISLWPSYERKFFLT